MGYHVNKKNRTDKVLTSVHATKRSPGATTCKTNALSTAHIKMSKPNRAPGGSCVIYNAQEQKRQATALQADQRNRTPGDHKEQRTHAIKQQLELQAYHKQTHATMHDQRWEW